MLESPSFGCGAAGNYELSVIHTNANSYTLSTNRYSYSTNNVTIGTSLTQKAGYGSATGNTILGTYFGSYGPISYYQQYTYSSNVVSNVITTYTRNRYGTSSTGTSAFGLFNIGSSGSTLTYATTTIFTYSNNVISNGNNIFTNVSDQCYGSAAGNSEMGVFNAGAYNGIIGQLALNIYMYSPNSVTTGIALSAASVSGGSATGNDITGIFTFGSNNNATNAYNYSRNIIGIGGYLSSAMYGGAAISNYNPGVNT